MPQDPQELYMDIEVELKNKMVQKKKQEYIGSYTMKGTEVSNSNVSFRIWLTFSVGSFFCVSIIGEQTSWVGGCDGVHQQVQTLALILSSAY